MKESSYFRKFKFTNDQVKMYLKNAFKDLDIAHRSNITEVRFTYSYNALLKGAISLLAATKGLKVRSIPGHHVAVLKEISEILKDDSIFAVSNAMRMKRNTDLYEGGIFISEKETEDYYLFAKDVLRKIEDIIKNRMSRVQ